MAEWWYVVYCGVLWALRRIHAAMLSPPACIASSSCHIWIHLDSSSSSASCWVHVASQVREVCKILLHASGREPCMARAVSSSMALVHLAFKVSCLRRWICSACSPLCPDGPGAHSFKSIFVPCCGVVRFLCFS